MRKYVWAFIAGGSVILQTILSLIAPPEQVTWLRWRIGGVLCGIVAFVALAIQLVMQNNEENKEKRERELREEEREKRLQESQAELINRVIAEYRASEQPHPVLNVNPMISDELSIGVDRDDPRIYLDIEIDSTHPFRTPFILHNRGGDTAHNVTIESFTLSGHPVLFPVVGAIHAGERAPALPTINEGSGFTQHEIFYWLTKDWNDNGKLIEKWPVTILIKYGDSLGQKRFEVRMNLVFHPIRYMMNKNYQLPAPSPYWEFRDIVFKRDF